MTPEERAQQLLEWCYTDEGRKAMIQGDLSGNRRMWCLPQLTDAIRAAVKEEQEACARLILETDVITSVIRTGEYPNGEEERENAYATLEAAARAIRARSNQPGA